MQRKGPFFRLLFVATLLSAFISGCKDKKEEVTPATQIEGSWRITSFILSDGVKQVDIYDELQDCDKLAVWVFKGGRLKTTNTTPSCGLSGGILDMDYEVAGSTLLISALDDESYKLSFADNTMTWSVSIDGNPGKIIFTRQ